jgi:hypothetical protein
VGLKYTPLYIAIYFSVITACSNKPAIVMSDKPGWQKIAETTVDFTKEHRELEIIGADRFSALQFVVKEAAVQLDSVLIYFENDSIQKVRLNNAIQAGYGSKVIELKGSDTSLRTIGFSYRTLPNRRDEKATVEIWGLKREK